MTRCGKLPGHGAEQDTRIATPDITQEEQL
jgi:hypothetical protein